MERFPCSSNWAPRAFTMTIGEFGVIYMIGGSIADETKVASVAIYDRVEAMDYSGANTYSIILIGITFLILLTMYAIKGSRDNPRIGW